MKWVAFIANGNVWSSQNMNWLGKINVLTCLDTNGRVVAWNPEVMIPSTLRPLKPLKPMKPLKPLKPMKPLKPLKPMKPLTPIRGWSALSFLDWINQ